MAKNQIIIEITDKGTVKRYVANVKKADKANNSLVKSATKLVGAYVGLRTAVGAANLAQQAAVAQDVAKAYDNLAKSTGIVGDQMLSSMQKATAGTIAEMQLMQQFSSAALLGLPLDRFDEMLNIARGASKATGQTMEFMLNSIVTALGRGSKLMLDNLGIMIEVGKANEEYAASLGKTSAALTDAERKQAFINKALDLGNANLEKMGPLTKSSADEYARLKAEASNLGIALGSKLNNPLSKTVGLLADMAKALTEIATTEDLSVLGALEKQLSSLEAKYVKAASKSGVLTSKQLGLLESMDLVRAQISNVQKISADAERDNSIKKMAEDARMEVDALRESLTADDLRGLGGLEPAIIDVSRAIEIERAAQDALNSSTQEGIRLTTASAIAIGSSADSIGDAAKSIVSAYIAESIAVHFKDWLSAPGIPVPLKLGLAAAGAFAVSKTLDALIPSFAQGGDFVTNGPQMIMVGDNRSGKEHVQITPSEKAGVGGNTFNFNISGGLVDENFVREDLIPMINRVSA